MIFCSECGHSREVDSIFCDACGTRFQIEPESLILEREIEANLETVQESFQCSVCMSLNPEKSAYCPECGSPQTIQPREKRGATGSDDLEIPPKVPSTKLTEGKALFVPVETHDSREQKRLIAAETKKHEKERRQLVQESKRADALKGKLRQQRIAKEQTQQTESLREEKRRAKNESRAEKLQAKSQRKVEKSAKRHGQAPLGSTGGVRKKFVISLVAILLLGSGIAFVGYSGEISPLFSTSHKNVTPTPTPTPTPTHSSPPNVSTTPSATNNSQPKQVLHEPSAVSFTTQVQNFIRHCMLSGSLAPTGCGFHEDHVVDRADWALYGGSFLYCAEATYCPSVKYVGKIAHVTTKFISKDIQSSAPNGEYIHVWLLHCSVNSTASKTPPKIYCK